MADGRIVVDIKPAADEAVRDAARELLFDYTRWLSETEHETHAVQAASGIESRQRSLVNEYLEEARRG